MNATNFQVSPSSVPLFLWELYIEHLCNFSANSWVAKVAYTFRVLAVLLILPFLILGLLDIASYGIARSLGVIDLSEASTSDKATVHDSDAPVILIHSAASESEKTTDNPSDHAYHFTSESGNLKLSGVGVFSPASSRPASPTLSRRQLRQEDGEDSEGLYFRKKLQKIADED
ncbi:hypothetical protein C8J56DRAFT_926441 [Mycena floridula]|nr:hypothetical protein C8J56DRAFT_926441 [Mycena floridula]